MSSYLKDSFKVEGLEGFDLMDLSWLMAQIDYERLLERLGINIVSVSNGKNGQEVISYCPDHYLFTGKYPSHPKWSFNTDTGKTQCWTEGRGSNIFWIIVRVKNLSPKDALKWILEKDVLDDMEMIKLRSVKKFVSKYLSEEKIIEEIPYLKSFEKYLRNDFINEDGYEFFMNPPGKRSTNIDRNTVDHFKVVQKLHGQYINRVIVPFYQKNEFVGFCAIDILGKKEWIKKHPGKDEKEYKKVLFPSKYHGFHKNETLFGYDDLCKNCDNLIIVEGAREVMKLWQEGFSAVAILGTEISSKQILLISEKCPKRVTIMMDGDEAGKISSYKIGKKLKRLFDTYISSLPENSDPKNYGKDDLEKFIGSSLNF